VVKEERRMRVDTNPVGKLFENFLASAFLSHPYRHPTIGWESDLDHLNVETWKTFITVITPPIISPSPWSVTSKPRMSFHWSTNTLDPGKYLRLTRNRSR